MIKAKHVPFWVWLSRVYTSLQIKSHFLEVKYDCEDFDKSKPILLIANHFSWWDGMVANYLTHTFFKKKFFVMMLEEQLKTRMTLSKAGMFSVKKGTRDIIHAINYGAEILTDQNHLLLMYPQGKIESLYHYPVKFESGLVKIIGKLQQPVELVFLTVLIEYFSFRKPTLFIFIKTHPFKKDYTIEEIEHAYNDFLIQSIKKQKE